MKEQRRSQGGPYAGRGPEGVPCRGVESALEASGVPGGVVALTLQNRLTQSTGDAVSPPTDSLSFCLSSSMPPNSLQWEEHRKSRGAGGRP